MSPIVSLCGTVGMLLPRSATFLYGFAVLYSMLCIFITVTIMTTLHGSRKAMCAKFLSGDRKINPRIFPLGCCLVCLPDIEPNEMNVRRIEWLVLQSPLLRIFLVIMNIVVFMMINTRNHIWFLVTDVLWIISLLIGTYGSYMMASLGSEFLKAYRVSLMFYMVDTTQWIYYLNKVVLNFFNGINFFGYDSVLSSSAKSH
uniref:Uncharacterized protein n=1 Tax=Acrobeloides nanus TaxID=290746 RepID=A0A914C944_9BILA